MKIQLHSDSLRVGRTPASLHLRARRACLRTALAALAALSFAAAQASAAVTEAWVQRYSNVGDSIDQAFKILRDAAGDFLLVGATADQFAVPGMVIIKYSGADGSVLWQKRHDGPAAVLISDPASPSLLAAVDAGGNLVVTTRADSNNNDYYTAKYAAADGALLWERRYDGPAHGSDIPSAVAVDGSGNAVVTGSSRIGFDPLGNRDYPADYYTAKYAAANGALLWEKRYDGPAQGWDYAMSVAVDASGDVVVTGGSSNETEINDLPYDFDYYTAKYAGADGALLWEKRYGGPADEEFAQAVAVDGSGNVVVTGYSYTPNSSSSDYYTVKYAAADGAFLWEKRYDGPAHKLDVPKAVVVDASGNVVVTGYSENGSGSPSLRNDYYTAKYAAANGALLWENRYNGPANDDELPMALAVDAGSNVVVTGYSYGLGSQYDIYTAKYAAADGALLWDKRFNGPTNSDDVSQGLAVDASGDVVVTGYSNYDFYTARYAAVNGALLWDNRYSGQSNRDDQARAVAVDGAGNVVATGYSYGGGAGNSDYYTARYAAANGALLWQKRGPGGGSAAVVDASGNVVVSGSGMTKYLADGTLVWTTTVGVGVLAVDASGNVVTGKTKHAAATGALLWVASDTDFAPTDVAVDPIGNMVVTGAFYRGNDTDADFYTAKFSAATGALLWAKRYNGPLNSDDYAVAVAADGAGNVVVSGHTDGGVDGAYNTYTAKYAAATGAPLWERHGAGATGGDFVEDMALDAGGNVVVTVSSHDINFISDYHTAKYAAADGALLWEKRYNGPGNGNDHARAVAVDASGNVVVTGQSDGNSGRRDYYTAAYAAADGALLWEKRYNGPANGEDSVSGPHSLALGPNGMVAITGASDGAFDPTFQVFDYATVVYRPSVPLVSFAAWAASFGLAGGDAAANADPDHDGLANGAEFVLGGNPAQNSATGSASPGVTISGGNLLFTFFRDDASETPDIALLVESGTNLVNWPAVFNIGATTAASSPGVSIAENGSYPDTITVAVPIGTAEAQFARLMISMTP